jgi:hypothetical protein
MNAQVAGELQDSRLNHGVGHLREGCISSAQQPRSRPDARYVR